MRMPLLMTALTAILASVNCVQAAQRFLLEPGATITPIDGTPEALDGFFTWEQYDTLSSVVGFNAITLSFNSESFSLNLHPNNDQGTGLYTDGSSSFSETVDVSGFPSTTLYIQSWEPGTYFGPITHPERLIFPGVVLAPLGGGRIEATLYFAARAVPEPSTVTTLGILAVTSSTLVRFRRNLTVAKSIQVGA
jgi:hypothetical protein